MDVRSPLPPTLSPLEKGGEGEGSGGMQYQIFCRGFPSGKRDILSAPALWGVGAGGRYRLKRKSVPGNSLMGCRGERFYFSQWVFTAAALPTTLKTGSRLTGRAIEVQKSFEGL
jgi:hypothetical protein